MKKMKIEHLNGLWRHRVIVRQVVRDSGQFDPEDKCGIQQKKLKIKMTLQGLPAL